ncbi:hypothetical protein [Actinoplanes sp. NPDC049802]|uniref:hypothetical protein n=1 Tax=Actinoplanes sp. NPDC049802 TaxID=3154742 RepID=UPI0034005208
MAAGRPRIPAQRPIADTLLGLDAAACRRLADNADPREIDRALAAALHRELDQAGQRGWQTAEIVRVVRREHTARHSRLVTEPGPLDPCLLPEWADRNGLDRATAIESIVQVLRLLTAMPHVGPVSPAPAGEPGRQLLDRVRALLAEAEATDDGEVAADRTVAAQELLRRSPGDGRDGGRRIAVDNPYEGPKALLLRMVAAANGCHAEWMPEFGLVQVTGPVTGLYATELLFGSLLAQAARAMNLIDSKSRTVRQSFLTAYAERIGDRLGAAAEIKISG